MNRIAVIRVLRWIAVIPAGVLGWYIAFVAGLVLLTGATNLCPAESLISGACIAPWFRYVEAVIICLSVALAGVLVVVLPAIVAPGGRRAIACAAFVAGLMVAVYLVFYTGAVLEFLSAMLAGLLSVVAVVRAERRRAGYINVAADQSY